MPSNVTAYKIAWLVFAASAIGFLTRCYFYAEPLWIDELHTAWSIVGNGSDVAVKAAQGNQTPFYFWTVFTICNLCPLSPFSLRLLSMIAGVISVVLGSIMTHRFTQSGIATLVTGLVLATESWLVFWSTEARPYALLQLAALIQFSIFSREFQNPKVEKHQSKFSPALVILTAVLPLIHLSAIFWIACQFIFCLIFIGNKNGRRTLLSLSLACVFLLSAVSVIGQVLSNKSDWNDFGGPSSFLNELRSLSILCVISCFSYIVVFLRRTNKTTSGSNDVVWLFAACSLGPPCTVMIASLLNFLPVAAPRYVSPSLVLLPIFCGILLAKCGKLEPWIAVAILISSTMTNPILQRTIYRATPVQFRQENWESAIEKLDSISRNERVLPPVFLFANLFEDQRLQQAVPDDSFIEYLKFPLSGFYPLENTKRIVPMPTLSKSRWKPDHLDLIKETNFALVIARVSASDMQLIMDEIQRLAVVNAVTVHIELFEQDGNNVRIGTIRIAQ